MTKTIKAHLNYPSVDYEVYFCGLCFTEVNEDDDYCRKCGAYFDVEYDSADDYEELKKANEKLNNEANADK